MTATSVPTRDTADRELVVERVFNAPRELVFKAWTEPERLMRWFGPKGWTLPVCRIDLRPGGVWHYCLRGPTGETSWGRAVYQEIVAPERLAFTDAFSDEAGQVNEAMPVMLITITFIDQGGHTRLTSRTLFATAAERQAIVDMGAIEGMRETWDRLDAYLAQAGYTANRT